MKSTNTSIREEEALRLVIAGTVSETGTEFFRALVKNLAEALGTAGAWVTEYLPGENKLRALAMWLNGDFVDHYEYDLPGTPCEHVIKDKTIIHIPEKVIELYPGDNDLEPLNAVSYLGAPLLDTSGSVLGHISVLETKPMPRDERSISLFEIFAARAAAEHRRLKIELEVREREEELSLLLKSAMDAILVLDSQLKIVRLNPAAELLFACGEKDLLKEGVEDFLVDESISQVKKFTQELKTRPEGRQQLWVPQDFVVRRLDQSVFSAEATFSRFESRNGVFYTLILRNADERVEAHRQIQMLTQEAEYLREVVRDLPGQGGLLGRSKPMRKVFENIRIVAPTDSTVLITGETGTGKELVARGIHRASSRAKNPMIMVNCAAVPTTLIESEFFGHERGAFTGATSRREGKFSLAHTGSIFLDEVGELPLELQAKLLRVLQEGEFEMIGGSKTLKVDVRIIAATNRNLKRMVSEGQYREDLYFRLNVFPIHIPGLHERGKDIELLAEAFTQRYARRMGKRIHSLDKNHYSLLNSYDWPGNVRELQNVIERAVILSYDSRLQLERAMGGISPTSIPKDILETEDTKRILTAKEMVHLECKNLQRALEVCDWKISGKNGAANLLGLPASTLSSRMKALQIHKPRV